MKKNEIPVIVKGQSVSKISSSTAENKASEEKISLVFKAKYEENYPDILLEDQKQFLHSITFEAIQILKELLPNDLFANAKIKEAIRTQEAYSLQEYSKDYKLLSSSWNDYDMNTKALKKYSKQLSIKNNDNFSFVKQFRKHCANSNVFATHSCCESSKLLEVTDKSDAVSHVICTECKKAYASSAMELYCYWCKEGYVSSILPSNESADVQPSTWEQYHCGVFVNQPMKCIRCRCTLYLNLKTDMLICLNKRCNFTSKPGSILWSCVVCKNDFRSEAKVYNAHELDLIKNAIRLALLLQRKASPSEFSCCQNTTPKEKASIDFIHKADCNGVLYKGTLKCKDIVVCSKCHGVNFLEKFAWTCPFCFMKIKPKQVQSIGRNNLKRETTDFRSTIDVTTPLKPKHDITSIVSPEYNQLNRKAHYSTLRDILEKRNNSIHLGTSSNITDRFGRRSLNEEFAPISIEPYSKKKSKFHILTPDDQAQYEAPYKSCQTETYPEPSSNERTLEEIRSESNIPSFSLENYDIVKPMGEGSFGKIYKVESKSKTQSFALKKVIAHDIEEIKQFKQEFELVYSVRHKNIMRIFNIEYKTLDFSTYSIYVLMELASKDWNAEIQARIKSKQHYKESELFNILKELASCLSFLQKKSISHRDIKPQNVLIFDNCVYKVADFGEAKELKLTKGQSTLKGTELYMSPALYNGLKNNLSNVVHDPYKSDVFSLGYCLLYASTLSFSVLTELREVSDMKTVSDSLSKHFKGKYSASFLNVLLKMLEIDEAKRYDCILLEKALK